MRKAIDIWPLSLPRVHFTMLTEYSPPRDEAVLSTDFKIYIPIIRTVIWPVKSQVMRWSGFPPYYPPTSHANNFFEREWKR